MVLPPYAQNDWRYQEPDNWDSYLPDPDDYDDAQGYIDALAAGSEDTSPAHGAYYDPIANVWRGGRRTEQEIALAEFNADRYLNPNNSFNKGPYAQMRLQNKIGFKPDMAQTAYHAYDEYGEPLLDPAILAMIEDQLGIGAYEPPIESPNPTTPNQPPLPDNGRQPGWVWDAGKGDWIWYTPIGGPSADWSTKPTTPGVSGVSGGGGLGGDTRGGGGGSSSNPLYPGSGPAPGPVPGMPEQPVDGRTGAAPGGLQDTPGLTNESTIDPRYPDWLLKRWSGKWGPKPTDALGVY